MRSRCNPSADGGTVLTWMLVTVVLLTFLGGLTLDLWRAFSSRHLVAGMVDAAAVAGASGVDEEAFRSRDVLQLDPVLAEAGARANLARQPAAAALTSVAVRATPAEVTVTAEATVDLTLTRVLLAGSPPLRVRVTATSGPLATP